MIGALVGGLVKNVAQKGIQKLAQGGGGGGGPQAQGGKDKQQDPMQQILPLLLGQVLNTQG